MSERRGHLGSEELALYVLDALSPARKEVVESHVFACEACAAGLAREACLEAALEELALRDRSPRVERAFGRLAPVLAIAPGRPGVTEMALRRSRWAGGVVGALAAAAALVLAFASASRAEAAGVVAHSPAFHDAAGDMSGAALEAEALTELRSDSLDGG